MAANRFGVKRYKGPTYAQLSVHSLAEDPSPTTTFKLTVAMEATTFSVLEGRLDQQLDRVLLSHSHLRRKAKPKNRRSRTPSPQNSRPADNRPANLALATAG